MAIDLLVDYGLDIDATHHHLSLVVPYPPLGESYHLQIRIEIMLPCGDGSKPCTPVVHIKIAGKWMFIPLKMVLIGIDQYPCLNLSLSDLSWYPNVPVNHDESSKRPCQSIAISQLSDTHTYIYIYIAMSQKAWYPNGSLGTLNNSWRMDG